MNGTVEAAPVQIRELLQILEIQLLARTPHNNEIKERCGEASPEVYGP
jgi:hypothetical protein